MLDWFTPAQWGTLFGLLTMGTVVITGFAAVREALQERNAVNDDDQASR